MLQRAAKDISLKMETEVCTAKAKIPPQKANIPVVENLSYHRSLFEKEIYIYKPSEDSLKSLNNFLKRTFVSILGVLRGGWSLSLTPQTYPRQICTKKSVVQ